MKRRHNYRAYPDGGQIKSAARLFGCVRVVFNDFITECERYFTADLRNLDDASWETIEKRVLTEAKRIPQRAWLAEVSAVPLQQSVRDAKTAYKNYFESKNGTRKGERVGKPRTKKRRDDRQAARFTRNARFKVERLPGKWGRVLLPGIGWVKFVSTRDTLDLNPSSVTLVRHANGSYEVSFVVDVDVDAVDVHEPTHPGRIASIDLGLTHLATITYSDGTREKVDNPRILTTALRSLRRKQRSYSRKQKGSKNRHKARVQVARQHTNVKNRRTEHHRALAHRLTDENQAVIVEALNIKGLTRSGAKGAKGAGMRRAMHDAAWAFLIVCIAASATSKNRGFAKVPAAYTSQDCALCTHRDGPKPLNVREWTCTNCGAHLDRDYNAALNVMLKALDLPPEQQKAVAEGLAETLNACGPDVRRLLASAVGETLTLVSQKQEPNEPTSENSSKAA